MFDHSSSSPGLPGILFLLLVIVIIVAVIVFAVKALRGQSRRWLLISLFAVAGFVCGKVVLPPKFDLIVLLFGAPVGCLIGSVTVLLTKRVRQTDAREDQMSETRDLGTSDGSMSEELRKLGELKERGILTEEEFSEAKTRLLSQSPQPKNSTAPGPQSTSSGSTQISWMLTILGAVFVVVSVGCFIVASEMSSYGSDPGAIARSLFSGDAAHRLQQARSQAQMLQSGAMVSLVLGGICLGIGLIRILRR